MILAENQRLSISSKSENMILVEKLIDDVCDVFNINEDFYGNILIALTEAVNNAIQHGNKADPSKQIDISFKLKGKQAVFTVHDQGTGFDYNQLPDPTNPENIENPNGRGVFLMRNLADEVEFNETGNEVSLKFNVAVN